MRLGALDLGGASTQISFEVKLIYDLSILMILFNYKSYPLDLSYRILINKILFAFMTRLANEVIAGNQVISSNFKSLDPSFDCHKSNSSR